MSAAHETVTLPSGGRLFLPPTRPGASPSSRLPSTRPSFNTHRSRSGSVQRILSAVPAPGLSHSATFLWGQAPPIECSSLSVAMWQLFGCLRRVAALASSTLYSRHHPVDLVAGSLRPDSPTGERCHAGAERPCQLREARYCQHRACQGELRYAP